MHGRAALSVRRRGAVTELDDLHQSSPLRVLFPHPAEGEPFTAAIVTTSGGMVGGDALTVTVDAQAGAEALVVAQAAEKVYRSAGPDCRITMGLTAAAGARLDYLPQETILFEGSRLRRTTTIAAEGDATVMAGEMMVLGRLARGERMAAGLVRDQWLIRRDGKLIWADALHMDGNIAARRDAAAGWNGANACATLVLTGPDAGRHLDAVRAHLTGRSGATVVNGVLLARWLADDPAALRENFAAVWGLLRAEAGYRADMPRLWQV